MDAALIILSIAIALDIFLQSGAGISSVIRGNRVSKEENKFALIREILNDLDSLRDEKKDETLTLIEKTTLEEKIEDRLKMLEKL
jgi:hypothetical protein